MLTKFNNVLKRTVNPTHGSFLLNKLENFLKKVVLKGVLKHILNYNQRVRTQV